MAPSLLEQVEALTRTGRRPPVHAWHPPLSGDIDIRIARDGSWWHEGVRMEREALVRLFASILRREGEDHFLVTPVEKWRIHVEDVPFLVVDCDVLGSGLSQELVLRTSVEDRFHLNGDHALRIVMDEARGEPAPYVHVRDGLEARLGRAVYYRLVALAGDGPEGGLAGVWSAGRFFALGRY